jgi:hypothetical protein
LVQALGDEDERCGSDLLESGFIYHVEGGLVDKPDVNALSTKPLNSVEGAIQHVAVRHDVARLAATDELVLARDEGVPLTKELGAVLLEDPGNFSTG